MSDPEIIAAALLHDTIEDTETTESELATHFGVRVAPTVAEVTDDKSIKDKAERKRLQIINAPHKSPGAALIKLADKTSNVRDVGARPAVGWSEERRLQYLDWAKKVVDALPVSNYPLKDAFEASLASSHALIKNSGHHGTNDSVVSSHFAMTLEGLYRKEGAPVAAHYFEGAGHSFERQLGIAANQAAAAESWNIALKFLQSNGIIPSLESHLLTPRATSAQHRPPFIDSISFAPR